jgi:hypothetical protein
MISPEGPGGSKTLFVRIIKMDPTGGNLVSRIVDRIETAFGEAVGCPFIKIFRRRISHYPELANADSVEKNSHNSPFTL